MAPTWGMLAAGQFDDSARGVNMLDGGAHFYGAYECSDGKYVSIGSIEPQFYKLLLELSGMDTDEALAASKQMGRQSDWSNQKRLVEAVFRTKTRAEWCALMEYTDVCFAPVLSMTEAKDHPHNKARNAFVSLDGVDQPVRLAACPTDHVPMPQTTQPHLPL